MENIIIVVHVVVALSIIGLILLQQGKGAEMGASFGSGASQTVFGSQGGTSFFTKATAVLAFVFFTTSFALAIVAKNKSSVGTDIGIPALIEQSNQDIPVVPGSDVPESDIPGSVERSAIEQDIPTATDSDIPATSESEIPATNN